jgi:hypothetical protein
VPHEPGAAVVVVKRVAVTFVVADEEEEDYYRTVWYMAGALLVLGGRGEVIPTLQRLFDRALTNWQGARELLPHAVPNSGMVIAPSGPRGKPGL